MLSTHQKKFVNTLKQKKFRDLNQSFIVEGTKMVDELLQSDFKIQHIYATKVWITNHANITAFEITEKELKSISLLKTPNEVLAIAKYKIAKEINLPANLTIALDKIQDPGNFGTIIRTADWFGIKNIICSNDSVDCYNPKVVQATMGSLFRVNIYYQNLIAFFTNNNKSTIYGALLNGNNVFEKKLTTENTILLMGNESKGISAALLPFVTEKISIPKFGQAESLNLAVATAIFCAEFTKHQPLHHH